jgi:hypothetical protein
MTDDEVLEICDDDDDDELPLSFEGFISKENKQ